MQLDIFDHSHDVMLRNDVVDALVRHDASAARSAWRVLSGEFPADDALPAFARLIEAVERRGGAVFATHDALRETRDMLNDVAPAAQRVFGQRASVDWMAPLWRGMAWGSARLAVRS